MDLPTAVPVMTLPYATLFPQAMLPLHIFEPRYRQMLKDSLASHRMFSVALQKPGRIREIPSSVAGLGLIRAAVTNKDGTSNLILQGILRVKLVKSVQAKPYRVYRVKPIYSEPVDSVEMDALGAKLLELAKERLDQGLALPDIHIVKSNHGAASSVEQPVLQSLRQSIQQLAGNNHLEQLVDLISCTLLSDSLERQTILETVAFEQRIKHLVHFLMAEIHRNRDDTSS